MKGTRQSHSNSLHIPCVLWLPQGFLIVLVLNSKVSLAQRSRVFHNEQVLQISAFSPRQKASHHGLTAGKKWAKSSSKKWHEEIRYNQLDVNYWWGIIMSALAILRQGILPWRGMKTWIFFFFLMHQKVYIINRCINVWKSVINNCITVVVWSDPQPPAWDTAAISQHDRREFYLSFFQVDI